MDKRSEAHPFIYIHIDIGKYKYAWGTRAQHMSIRKEKETHKKHLLSSLMNRAKYTHTRTQTTEGERAHACRPRPHRQRDIGARLRTRVTCPLWRDSCLKTEIPLFATERESEWVRKRERESVCVCVSECVCACVTDRQSERGRARDNMQDAPSFTHCLSLTRRRTLTLTHSLAHSPTLSLTHSLTYRFHFFILKI